MSILSHHALRRAICSADHQFGFAPETCEPGGPIDILRRKLAAEPQIHGGKKSRLEFVHPDDETPINPAPAPPPPGVPVDYVERKTAR